MNKPLLGWYSLTVSELQSLSKGGRVPQRGNEEAAAGAMLLTVVTRKCQNSKELVTANPLR